MRLANRTLLLAIVLLALNFYICHELFWIEYTRHMGSIEGAFIGTARWAMHHWGDLTWFPLWYGGVPYQNTYPPLLHLCVAALATGAHTSAAHAYHFLTALAYLLGPLALYAVALRWSRSAWTAFSAALIYSTVSISAWILPEIRNDLGGALFPRRLQTLVYYGEGPHVASLLLLPLAILAVDAAISSRRARPFAIATILTAAILLTNWFGTVALVVAVSCLLLAHFGSKNRVWSMIAAAAAIGVCAYLVAMPLAPPSTLKTTFSSTSTLRGTAAQIYGSLPLKGVAVLAALGLTKLAIRKLSFALQFSILFTLIMTIFAVATHWDVNVIPQAARYHLEMEMGFALVIAFGGQAIFRTPRAATLAVVLLLIGTIVPIRRERNYARNFLLRSGDITSTIEWRTANWLNQHWSGGRVMPPGSVQFWMTAFSDIPLFGGGYQPGELEPVYPMAEYEIYSGAKAQGREAEVAVLWFKALGVEAAGVSGPRSTEYFRPFNNWRKYEGALEVLWREGDNVLYRVQPPHSLARIVPKSALVARAPENGIDIDPLRPYVAALDDSSMPAASFTWTSAHSAKIRGSLADGQVISVQEAWHPGWRANVPMTRDALGQIVLKPSPGAFDVDLIFDGGAEMKIARACSVVTALGLVFALIVRRKR